MNLQQARALFINQYAGIGLKMSCIAKSFQLDDKELRGVLLNDNLELTLYLSDKGYGDFFDINEWQLNLRSVSQLTDEEFLFVSIMSDPSNEDELYDDQNICNGKYQISEFQKELDMPVDFYQYLLRIGILLPLTYLDENNKPVMLQPDEIIELGWAKIN